MAGFEPSNRAWQKLRANRAGLAGLALVSLYGLIALAVAHAVQCPYCIDAYTQASLEKGSNIEEMTEAAHVACAIRGGASLAHGVQMRNVADKLSM